MIDDASREIDRAMSYVRASWTDERARRAERQIQRRVRRRRHLRVAGGTGALGLALVAGWLALSSAKPTAEVLVLLPGEVQLSDGSSGVATLPSSRLELAEVTSERRVVRVARGGARFDVAPTKDRAFSVRIGEVEIDARGTAFTAEERNAGVRVAVERGRVQVTWAHQKFLLYAGQSAQYPPLEQPPDPALAAGRQPLVEPLPKEGPPFAAAKEVENPRPRASSARWQALADKGAFEEAYRELDRDKGALRSARFGDARSLMRAADVARLSGHPREALPSLRAVIERFSRDHRAPLAAFTLGLVELEDLGRPGAAAAAFARARRLDPNGELAEDALAREVEAWRRSGDDRRARELAGEYFLRYPDGRRAASVQKHGELR
jgi:transmembrane sensor